MACKKKEADFSYSPTEPRAGQAVSFSNLSTDGEEWAWTFGDGGTSSLKSPSYTYKKPGTYMVTLKVDNKSSMTRAREITVYDTIPTFVASDSVFVVFKDYTFKANIYNPYSYAVSYTWTVDGQQVGTESSLTTWFTQPDKEVKVGLRVVLNTDTTDIFKTFFVADRTTRSVLLRTAEGDFRQRIFEERAEEAMPVAAADIQAVELLDKEQDTLQVYNDSTFRLSALQAVFPGITGFHIAHRKIYYRADGLWVAHINGADAVQIDAVPCVAMTLDTEDNRVYWANAQGVWYMPFVGSDNNRFVTEPVLLNSMNHVTKIAADAVLR